MPPTAEGPIQPSPLSPTPEKSGPDSLLSCPEALGSPSNLTNRGKMTSRARLQTDGLRLVSAE